MIRARPQPRYFQTALLRTAWLLYHIPIRLSRGFGKVFSKNFLASIHPERKCPSIISHSPSLVKRFSKSFSTFPVIFPRFAPQQCPVLWRPAYYSTSLPLCQQVCTKFFEFGEGGESVQKDGGVFVHNTQYSIKFKRPRTETPSAIAEGVSVRGRLNLIEYWVLCTNTPPSFCTLSPPSPNSKNFVQTCWQRGREVL